MFEYLSFETIKILAEKKILIPYVLLLGAAMKDFQTHYKQVVSPLTVSDLEMLIDNSGEAISALEELGLIKVTKNHIVVGYLRDNEFFTLMDAPSETTKPTPDTSRVTGRYVSLLKKYETIVVETLVFCNRAFHKKFGFNDTAPLQKQINCLNNVYDTSGLSLQQIYDIYIYFLDNYKKYKLDSPSLAAFNGFFSSVVLDYKTKSYNTQEEKVDVNAFKNFTGRK